MAGELAVAYISIVPSMRGAQKEIEKQLGDTSGAGRAGTSWGKRFGAALGNAAKRAAKAGVVTVAAALTAAGAAGVKSAIQIDQTRRVLTGLYGSASDASDMLDRIGRVAKKSPISASAYRKAAENLAYMGIKGETAEGMLTNVGKAIVAAGGGDEGLDRVNQGLLKIVNSGRVYAADLNMISEAGVPIFSGLAEHFGTNIENIRKMVSAGEVGLEDVLSVMENATGDTFQSALKAGEEASQGLAASFRIAFDNIREAIGRQLEPAIAHLAPLVQRAGAAIADGLVKYGPMVASAFSAVASVIGKVVSTLWRFKAPIAALVGLFLTYRVTMGALGAAQLAWAAATNISTIATKGQAIATRLLNKALLANPIGLAVTALVALATGLVYAYKKSETFREIVQAAWSGIKTAFTAAWAAIQPILASIGEAIITFWNTNARPALMAFKSFITDTLWPAIQSFYSTVIAPIFTAIGTVVKTVWNSVIWPVLKAWWSYMTNVLFPVIRFLWSNVVMPIFKLVGGFIKTTWNAVVRPALQGMWHYLNNVLFPIIRFLWNNVVSPIFRFIGNHIRNVWNGVIKPAFDAIKSGVNAVGTAFGAAKDAVKRAWDKLKGIVKEPIRVSVNFINDKLIGGINKLLPKKFEIPTIPGFATGGPVRGRGTSTSDSILARLSRNEHVLTAADVKALGGHARVEAMRAAARAGQFHIPGFKRGGNPFAGAKAGGRGGRVYPVPGSKAWTTYPGHTGIDFPRPMGTPVVAAHRGPVIATPRLGYSYGHHVKQAGDGGLSIYAHLSKILVRVGQMLSAGQRLGLVGSTGNALDVDTPVLTANRGWVRHGALVPGDLVYGEDGKPTSITHVQHWSDRPTYRVTFDDGSTIDADENHLWGIWDLHGDYEVVSTTILRAAAGMVYVPEVEGDFARPRRLVVSVELVESRDTNCITVDSESHLYLAGHELVPTHNSTGPHLHYERRPPGTDVGTGAYLRGAIVPPGGAGAFASSTVEENAWDWLKSKFNFSGFIGNLKDKLAGTEGIFSGGRIAAMAGDLAGKIWSFVKDKFKDLTVQSIEGAKKASGFLSPGGFLVNKLWNDDGGLNHGRGFMAKNVTAPERVLSPRQTRAFESAMARDFGAEGPAKISRDDLDYLAYQIGREVLAGAGAVARGLDDEREYDRRREARGLIGGVR